MSRRRGVLRAPSLEEVSVGLARVEQVPGQLDLIAELEVDLRCPETSRGDQCQALLDDGAHAGPCWSERDGLIHAWNLGILEVVGR